MENYDKQKIRNRDMRQLKIEYRLSLTYDGIRLYQRTQMDFGSCFLFLFSYFYSHCPR
jgi:hypothetical protein